MIRKSGTNTYIINHTADDEWHTCYTLEYSARKAVRKEKKNNTILTQLKTLLYTFVYTGVPGVISRRLAPNPEIDLSLNCYRRFIEQIVIIVFFFNILTLEKFLLSFLKPASLIILVLWIKITVECSLISQSF